MRKVLKALGLTAAVLLVGVLLVALAWVASNLGDADERPVPAVLQPPPSPPGSPLFFRLQGLLAPPGQDVEAAGRAAWARVASGAAPASAPEGQLAMIKGAPLACQVTVDCVAQYRAAGEVVAAQLAPHQVLLDRCQALMADLHYVEPRSSKVHPNGETLSFGGLMSCTRGFTGQALAAAQQGDRVGAVRALAQARRLVVALVEGQGALLTRLVASNATRGVLDAVSALAQTHPDWIPELLPLTEPWPAAALDAGSWLRLEHAATRALLDLAIDICRRGETPSFDWGPAPRWGCRTGIGLQPNATHQRMETQLATLAQAAERGGLEAVRTLALQGPREPADFELTWRNTIGTLMVEAARPEWAVSLARQSDFELYRLATHLALAASRVQPAERGAWLQGQTVAPAWRQRLAWEDNGAVLVHTPWLADAAPQVTLARTVRLVVPVSTKP